MSLPLSHLRADPIAIKQPPITLKGAPYLYTVKQMPLLKLTQILDQLTEFSRFSNELFLELANSTIKISDRIKTIESNIETIKLKVATNEKNISIPILNFNRDRNCWKSNHIPSSNLFTKQSQPTYIQSALNQCPAVLSSLI
jgi:hypothetical protein